VRWGSGRVRRWVSRGIGKGKVEKVDMVEIVEMSLRAQRSNLPYGI